MVTVGAGEGGPGWRGRGERVPEIRSGVRYVQREGGSPGDQGESSEYSQTHEDLPLVLAPLYHTIGLIDI